MSFFYSVNIIWSAFKIRSILQCIEKVYVLTTDIWNISHRTKLRVDFCGKYIILNAALKTPIFKWILYDHPSCPSIILSFFSECCEWILCNKTCSRATGRMYMTFFPIPHNFHQILSLFPVATTSKRLMSKNVVICMCPSFAFFLYFSFILLSTIKGDFLRKKQNLLPKILT